MSESKEYKAFGRDVVKRVEELATKKGVTMAQIATAWVLANEGMSTLFKG
jgi:aryl-alcohol dehydrogenase-like predicted oxidoreductase